MTDPVDKLTTKQRVFIQEYLICWNATEAARRAGYAQPNVQGSQNLVKPSIRGEIQRRLAEKAMSADEVLARLADHARGSMGDFLRVDEEDVLIDVQLTPLTQQEELNLLMGGSDAIKALIDERADDERLVTIKTAKVKRAAARLDLLAAKDKLHLIKKYSLDEKGKVTIELYDAQSALAHIGKHHGLFVDRVKNDVTLTPDDAANLSDEQLEAELKKRGVV